MFSKKWVCLNPIDDMESSSQPVNAQLKVIHWLYDKELANAAFTQKLAISGADVIGITNECKKSFDDLDQLCS